MNTRSLTVHEADNLARLHEAGLPVAPLFPTRTSLGKSILDATEPVRALFYKHGVHDFASQAQGMGAKVLIDAVVFGRGRRFDCRLSLYRPITKEGDPRMWPANFARHAAPNQAWVVSVQDGRPVLLSLSHSFLAHQLDLRTTDSAETRWIAPLAAAANQTANELLAQLRALAEAGPLKAVCQGSTAVGRTLESVLGIAMNSSRNPDYKGIELKAGRSSLIGTESRAQLFGRVPDWTISPVKNVSELLARCGYERDGARHLRCTISSLKANSQALVLNAGDELLEEISRRHKATVVVWRLAGLEHALARKHRETFWVKTRSIERAGVEHFELLSVVHTRNPVAGQLTRLLDTGSVTVDHMISGRLDNSRAHDKGPSFKVERYRLAELFRGVPREYDLQAS